MNNEIESQNLAAIDALLHESGLVTASKTELNITTLAGDGSSRKFWRIKQGDKRICLAVAPPVADKRNLAEAKAARTIGMHLLQRGVRVPEQYGWNKESGVLLFEDLGDIKLHDATLKEKGSDAGIKHMRPHYLQIVESLAAMQVNGVKGFDEDWCWDTSRYDKTLMLERESGYFLRAFWQDFLGNEEPVGLADEFEYLAERAAIIPSDFFLHRDFQSRNIMLYSNAPCVIDFQGGRLGPLAYDLASLLIDPYAGLPYDFQEELFEKYLDALEKLIVVDRRKFVEEYLLLALQRNLQIVGAFAFLSKQRKKVFFEQYLRPAVASLNTLLDCEMYADMQVLKGMASSAEKLLGR